MNGRPTAAKGTFPYSHRTVAEIDAMNLTPADIARRQVAMLERVSKRRPLTDTEITRFKRLLRRAA